MDAIVIAVDPVEERERKLAAGLQQMHRELLGYGDSTVHVHIEADVLVYVVEGPQLPTPAPEVQDRVCRAVAELVRRIVGSELQDATIDSRPAPDLKVSVLRLASAEAGERVPVASRPRTPTRG